MPHYTHGWRTSLERAVVNRYLPRAERPPQTIRLMPTPPKKLRKQYANKDYPNVVLRFEDGHEIEILKGAGKTFDCYAGETIKVLAMYDKTSKERELVESRKADAFPDA